jgi:LCP family protein required for cell wall assembly
MSDLDPYTTPYGERSRRRVIAQRATRRSATLTIASALIPGLGLLRTRYKRLGVLILFGVVLVLLAVLARVVMLGPTKAALSVAVSPNALLLVAAFALVAGLIWVLTIILAHRGSADSVMTRRQRVGLRALTALLCVAVILPMGTAVSYSLIQRDIVASLFGVQQGTTDEGETSAQPGTGADPWEGVGRVNMLLLGSDAGSDRIGTRTDSMIVASINPQTGDTLLFSLPRNLENVPFPKSNPLYKLYPQGYNCGPPDCLLNGVWTLAEGNAKLFGRDPNPGLTTVRGVIQEITGLRLHYTTVINLDGFQSLVDAMGGVDVTINEKLPIGGHLNASGQLVSVDAWIQPGAQHLDGYHALWFARSRLASDDYNRMRRQRCLVGKILDQVNPVSMLQKYPALAQVAKNNITTNIPADDLPAWMELVRRIQGASIRSLAFTIQNINPGHPNFTLIRSMVHDALDPAATTATAGPTKSTSTRTTTGPTKSTTTKTTTGSTKSTSTRSTTSSSSSSSKTTDALVDLRDAC